MKKKTARMLKKLMIWQKALQLVSTVDLFRRQSLPAGVFGLSPALYRSIVAVVSCLAEAFQTHDPKKKLRMLRASQSALSECNHYLILAGRKNEYNPKKIRIEVEQVSVQLESYITALRK